MADLMITVVLFIAVGLASFYIMKEKKSGTKCIGCPSGKSCCSSHQGHSQCSCGCYGKGQ